MSYSFDGLDDLITSTGGPSFILGQVVTFAAWVKPSSFGESSRGQMITHGIGNDNNARFAFRVDNQNVVGSQTFVLAAARSSIDSVFRATGTAVLTLNQWVHLAATYDGTNPANVARMYKNGIEQGTTVIAPGSGTMLSDNLVVHVGSDAGTSRSFAGLIGGGAIWKRILTPDEIWRVYDRGPLACVRDLAFWYSFGRSSLVEYSANRTPFAVNGALYQAENMPRPQLAVA